LNEGFRDNKSLKVLRKLFTKIINFYSTHHKLIKVILIDIINGVCVTSVWQVKSIDVAILVELYHTALLLMFCGVKSAYYKRIKENLPRYIVYWLTYGGIRILLNIVQLPFEIKAGLFITLLGVLFKLASDFINKF